MAETRLSRDARADLVRIRLYGNERFGPDAADRFFLSFDGAFALLEEYPLAGPEADDLLPGLRRLSHRPYHIFYRVDGSVVDILRVLHHAQDARRHLHP